MRTWDDIDTGDGQARVYVSYDPTATNPGVVVLHAWWGLDDDVTNFANRLAGEGFFVVAPDLVDGATASTVENAEALATGADEAHADAVVLAAIDYLDRMNPAGVGVALVGFSFGAWWAVKAASERANVKASVVYYGAVWGDFVSASSAPVLGHFAENDEFEPDENVETFEKELGDAGRAVTVHRYRATGHWFAEPSRSAYRPESAELAYERTVKFLRSTLG